MEKPARRSSRVGSMGSDPNRMRSDIARTSSRTFGSTTLFLVGMSGHVPPLTRAISSSMSRTFKVEHARRCRVSVDFPAHEMPTTRSLTISTVLSTADVARPIARSRAGWSSVLRADRNSLAGQPTVARLLSWPPCPTSSTRAR
jgi:hypothetical protein